MAYKYCVRRKTDKSKTKEQVKYYAVPISSGTVGTEELAENIAHRCTPLRRRCSRHHRGTDAHYRTRAPQRL